MHSDERRVGVRSYAEVDVALNGLVVRRKSAPRFSAGAAAAYEWAMGQTVRSPVTGAEVHGIPDLGLLTAEVDAAVIQLEDPTTPVGNRDYTRGAHDALAWVCGYSDQLP